MLVADLDVAEEAEAFGLGEVHEVAYLVSVFDEDAALVAGLNQVAHLVVVDIILGQSKYEPHQTPAHRVRRRGLDRLPVGVAALLQLAVDFALDRLAERADRDFVARELGDVVVDCLQDRGGLAGPGSRAQAEVAGSVQEGVDEIGLLGGSVHFKSPMSRPRNYHARIPPSSTFPQLFQLPQGNALDQRPEAVVGAGIVVEALAVGGGQRVEPRPEVRSGPLRAAGAVATERLGYLGFQYLFSLTSLISASIASAC